MGQATSTPVATKGAQVGAAADGPAWHALEAEAAAEALGASLLGIGDAEAAERLREFGPNRLDPPRPPSRWRKTRSS